MRSFLVLLVSGLAPTLTNASPQGGFDCKSVSDQNECNSHDDVASFDACGWCTSKDVDWSGCVASWEIERLPVESFDCKKHMAPTTTMFPLPTLFPLKCCYGPGQCKSSQHCDYVDKDNCGTGQCLDGEPCYSAQFQKEDQCPRYCKWVDQEIGDTHLGYCTDNFGAKVE